MHKLLAALTFLLLCLAFAGWESVQAQETSADCPAPTSLGELSDILSASGVWSGDECDRSQFLDNRPGRLFTFSLAEPAEVRIDLSSSERDTLLYLQSEDGRLIDADDDTGGGVNARIERGLSAGTYQIEAGALGWSGRQGGSFELTVRVVEGCLDVVDLGVLVDTLAVTSEWSHFGCQSDYRPDRAGQRYRFELSDTRRIQIDLTSELADSFVYLLDESGTLLESDDDGGVGFNSRIERFLGAGVYTIEATNWGDRDLKGLIAAEFELTIASDEDAPIIKLEQIDAPDRVVLGLPFELNYRVGNLGDEPLSALPDARVQVRVRWPYISDWRTPNIDTTDGETELFGVGASYHSSDAVSAFGSQSLPQLQPFEGLFRWRAGPTDVMLQVILVNNDFESLSSHWLSRPIMVLSGIEFDPVTVSVDNAEYRVAAVAADDGVVTTDVAPLATEDDEPTDATDDEAGLDLAITSRAIYAAGVRTQVLAGFGSAIDELRGLTDSFSSSAGPIGLPISEVAVPSAPTLDVLLQTLNSAHDETLLNAGFDPQQFQSADMAERTVVLAGRAAALRIEQFSRDWSSLLEPDRVISSNEALEVHARLAFAQQVDARLIEAALLVLMKRDAEGGWSDPGVAAALEAYAGGVDCGVDSSALSFSDGALRLQSPIYGHMLDRAYCGASAASDDHDLLLSGLDLDSNPVIPAPEAAAEPPAPPAVTANRLLARVLSDGQVEFAADLSNGDRALPVQRLLPVGAAVDQWLRTAPITHDGEELGRIYARRLSNGLVQATYVPDGVGMSSTSRWVVPEDAPVNAWLASAELERGRVSGDDLVQRVADQAAGPGAAQFGDHLSLLALIENNLQRNP